MKIRLLPAALAILALLVHDAEAQVFVPGSGGGGGGGSVTQGTVPWVDDITQWANVALGAPSNYGTSPGAVAVPGVNAFVTNTITCANCSGSGASATDTTTFTPGTSIFAPTGGFFQTTATSNPLANGQQGAFQVTAQRALFANLRNSSGTEIGTSAAPVQVTGANGTFPATGTTSNAGSAVATSSANVPGVAYNYGFNGTTWDQLQVDGNKYLKVDCITGCSGGGGGGSSQADAAAFTPGTTSMTVTGGLFQTSISNLTTGQAGAMALTADRNVFTNTNRWAGTALGAPSNYGTSPGAVTVPGFNAFITNTPGVTCALCAIASLQPTNAAQGSASSGQTGNLAMGVATSGAPADTTGQSYPLSLTTTGDARVFDTAAVAAINAAAPALPLPTLAAGATDSVLASASITVQDTGSTSTSSANSQAIVTGSPTAGSVAAFALANGYASARFQVTGTWTGTLTAEGSADGGTTWTAVGVHQNGTSYSSSSFTANFEGVAPISGFTNIRIRATAAMTGTATVASVQTVNPGAVYIGNAGNLGAGLMGAAVGPYGVSAGGRAQSSEPTATTTGFLVNRALDLTGKTITSPYANRESMIRGSASATGTGATALLAAAGASVKNYVSDVECGRSDAGTAAIIVTFSDAAATIMVLPNSGGGGGNNKTFNVPLVTAANTAFTFTSGTGTTTVYCSAQGFTGY